MYDRDRHWQRRWTIHLLAGNEARLVARDGKIPGRSVTMRPQSDEPGIHVLMRLLRDETLWELHEFKYKKPEKRLKKRVFKAPTRWAG